MVFMVSVAACTTVNDIGTIKSDEYLGERVVVRGTVDNTISIGELSGYTVTDENGDTIAVASEAIPAEGDVVTVSGVLRENVLVGYYIDADE